MHPSDKMNAASTGRLSGILSHRNIDKKTIAPTSDKAQEVAYLKSPNNIQKNTLIRLKIDAACLKLAKGVSEL